jgi:hypothetical protein
MRRAVNTDRRRALEGAPLPAEICSTRGSVRLGAERDCRARLLDFAASDETIRRRYFHQEATVAELAAALGCAQITVLVEMDGSAASAPAARSTRARPQVPTASRLDLRARRYAVKLFLSGYHEAAYRLHYGTVPPEPYAIDILGHAHEFQFPVPFPPVKE